MLQHLHTPRTKKLGRVYPGVKQLCVPMGFREQVACCLHDRNCHIGFDRLYATAISKYLWFDMYVFLKEHVKLVCCVRERNHIQNQETSQ
jgi:hypothetical protein